MFASNLSHRDRKPKYTSKFETKHGSEGKRWPFTPFPFLAPWHSRPPAIKMPPRPVPAGPLISWPKNASCSRIPPQACCASLPLQLWATARCRLSPRPCTAPLSCSLQPLLTLSLLSLRPSLLQSVSIVSLLLNQGNSIFEPVCVFSSSAFAFLIEINFSFKSLFAIWSLSPQWFHYHFYPSIVYYSFSAVSEIFNYSDTCAVPSVCNAVVLLILLKLRPVFTFPQRLMTKRLWIIYTYTCSPMFSIDVVASALDNVFADSRIALLCHALCICVARAPTESWPFSLLVHWAFRACYRSHLPLLHHASLPQN